MLVNFSKMHGLGNDYIYFYNQQVFENVSDIAIKLSKRNFSIGADGLVFILPSEVADFKMRMFNADGSEGRMCGNASRCIAKYVYEKGYTNKKEIALETLAGIKKLSLEVEANKVKQITLNLGEPILEANKIPCQFQNSPVINQSLNILGSDYKITAVSMGNPHAVIFVPEINDKMVFEIGPAIEKHLFFPERTNVEFVKVLSANCLEMRVWERGSGETLACGTGAAAVAVAGVLNEVSNREVTIRLLGGELQLNWLQADNCVYQTGPAEFAFEGEVEI